MSKNRNTVGLTVPILIVYPNKTSRFIYGSTPRPWRIRIGVIGVYSCNIGLHAVYDCRDYYTYAYVCAFSSHKHSRVLRACERISFFSVSLKTYGNWIASSAVSRRRHLNATKISVAILRCARTDNCAYREFGASDVGRSRVRRTKHGTDTGDMHAVIDARRTKRIARQGTYWTPREPAEYRETRLPKILLFRCRTVTIFSVRSSPRAVSFYRPLRNRVTFTFRARTARYRRWAWGEPGKLAENKTVPVRTRVVVIGRSKRTRPPGVCPGTGR